MGNPVLAPDLVEVARRALEVRGVVQGVGFRPFVHALATRLGLSGQVVNQGGAVRIEIEGAPAQLDRFARELVADGPPLARLHEVRCQELPPLGTEGFQIAPSEAGGRPQIFVPRTWRPAPTVCASCRTLPTGASATPS